MLIRISSATEAPFNSIFFDKNTGKLSYKNDKGIIQPIFIGELPTPPDPEVPTLNEVTTAGNVTIPPIQFGDGVDNYFFLISNSSIIGTDEFMVQKIRLDADTGIITDRNGIIKPYKSYVANVRATGSNDPIENFVNENNFVSPFLYARVGAGEYIATCTTASFSNETTRIFVDLKAFAESTEVGIYTEIIDPLTVAITIHEANGTPVDGFLLDIEIRDYN